MPKVTRYYDLKRAHTHTREFYEQIYSRFLQLKREKAEQDERLYRNLSDRYYIEILSEEFHLSASHIRKIIYSLTRR